MHTSSQPEDSDAYRRFQTAMKQLLSVSKATLDKRVENHRAKSAAEPNRRGPKRKPTP
jgi:hypothetical protein